MKAEYITTARAVNPLYSSKDKRAAKETGKEYAINPYIEIPVGYVEEGPLVWTHCVPGHLNAPPVCKPIDNECRDRVQKWMKVERPKELESIRQMLHPSNYSKMSKKQQGHLDDLKEAYGLDTPAKSDPVQTPKPALKEKAEA